MKKMQGWCVILGFWLLWPAAVWACAYPAPVRSVNAVLLEVLNGNGQIANHQRVRLQRAVGQIAPGALEGALTSELSRRDARALGTVMGVATQLARGVGRDVDPNLRGSVMRIRDGIHTACAQDDATQTGTGEDATGAEHGLGRSEGSGGRGLTFGEGLVRLSYTFTIYVIFLAFLLSIRRILNARLAAATVLDVPAPAAHASPRTPPLADGSPSPSVPAGATPPLQ